MKVNVIPNAARDVVGVVDGDGDLHIYLPSGGSICFANEDNIWIFEEDELADYLQTAGVNETIYAGAKVEITL